MQIIVRPTFNQKTLNKVFHIGAMIICIGLIGSHPVEYKRFYNDRWRIELHERDTLMLQAKNCPNRKIRQNSALYLLRKDYLEKYIIVSDNDLISPQLLKNTIPATSAHWRKLTEVSTEVLVDTGAHYRGFPFFVDSEEKLFASNDLFLYFDAATERWLLRAL